MHRVKMGGGSTSKDSLAKNPPPVRIRISTELSSPARGEDTSGVGAPAAIPTVTPAAPFGTPARFSPASPACRDAYRRRRELHRQWRSSRYSNRVGLRIAPNSIGCGGVATYYITQRSRTISGAYAEHQTGTRWPPTLKARDGGLNGTARGSVMKTHLLAGVALLALLGGSAIAADLPVRKAPVAPPVCPTCDWNGFYFGFNVGGSIGRDSTDNAITLSPNAPSAGVTNPI
jgi:hypothetical protein